MNLEKAKDEFLKYTENYDLNNSNIFRKQTHSLRVMEISKQISEGLNLSQEEIELATLIGLLHDIARFEQYTKFKTFKDARSVDHGDLGVEILDKDIRKYIKTDKYDEIIKIAIKNHNKYAIENGLTKEQELFSKIVRDADKIDIIYEAIEMFWENQESEVENSKISREVVEQFKKQELINKLDKETLIDDVVSIIAFVFDINYDVSLQIIKNNNYINKIVDRFNMKDKKTKEELEEIRKIANEYIKM